MTSSNEYTEDYGKIEPLTITYNGSDLSSFELNNLFNKIINDIYNSNKYIIHQFSYIDSFPGDSFNQTIRINKIYIDNYANYYGISVNRNSGMYICTSYCFGKNPIINNNNTTYKLSNKIIDIIKTIYKNDSDGNRKNPDDIFDILNIIKNIIVSQSDEVTKKHTITYQSLEKSDVYIAGTFNNWEKIKMTNENDIWKYDVELDKGTYEYKFIINNEWKYDETQPFITNNGIINNIVIL